MNKDNRNDDGRFARTCGCNVHEGDKNSLYLTDLRKRKGISGKNVELLLQQGAITESTRYICKNCLENLITVKVKVDSKSDEHKAEKEQKEEVEFYRKIIEVATKIESEISADIKNLPRHELTSFDDIIAHDPAKWLLERPEILLHLITALCNVDFNTTTPDRIILIAKIIELIYACRHSKLVLPNHFIENLLCYSYTNCKSFLNFLGDRSPGGAYSFLCNWLQKQSKEPLEFPEGLVKSIFDNSQKVGKTYLISGTQHSTNKCNH